MIADLVTKLFLNSTQFDNNIKKSSQQIQEFKRNVNKVKEGFTGFSSALAGAIIPIAGITSAAVLAQKGLSYAVSTSIDFEKALSSLKSLTGVTTQELSYFKEEAIRLGSTTTQTASQVVDAFKLMGSQMPELLKNKEALTMITEQAIVLAEAAGIEVPEAAKALSGSLNQMGANAYDAGKYINILAAASQKGSADIPYLNAAIEKAGGTASTVGIKYSELVAAIEAIAPKISDASEAGTDFRNIILALEQASDRKLRPSVVGLGTALDNLAQKNYGVTKMTELFGKRTVTAALALVNARGKYDELNDSIQNTNTAYEQQRINTDNVAGSIAGLESAWEGFILSLNHSNGTIKTTIDSLKDIVEWAGRALKSKSDLYKEETGKQVQDNNKTLIDRLNKDVESGLTPEQAIKKNKVSDYASYDKDEAIKINKQKRDLYEQFKESYSKYRKSNNETDHEEFLAVARKINELNSKIPEMQREAAKAQSYYNTIDSWYASKTGQKVDKPTVDVDKNDGPNGSLKHYKFQLSELQKQLSTTTTDISRTSINKEIENLKTTIKEIEDSFEFPKGSIADIQNQITSLNNDLSKATSDTARIAIQRKIDVLKQAAKDIDNALKYSNVSDEYKRGADHDDYKTIVAKFANDNRITKAYEGLKVKGYGNIGKLNNETKDWASSLNAVSDAMATLNTAMGDGNKTFLSFAAVSGGAIAQMIIQLQALCTAKGVASAFDLPFPASLAAVATVVSTVASVFSALPAFETGGIVPGASFCGDNITARVNSGEMILNRAQQANLFNMINSGDTPVSQGNDLEFKLRGDIIYGVLKNYTNKIGKLR